MPHLTTSIDGQSVSQQRFLRKGTKKTVIRWADDGSEQTRIARKPHRRPSGRLIIMTPERSQTANAADNSRLLLVIGIIVISLPTLFPIKSTSTIPLYPIASSDCNVLSVKDMLKITGSDHKIRTASNRSRFMLPAPAAHLQNQARKSSLKRTASPSQSIETDSSSVPVGLPPNQHALLSIAIIQFTCDRDSNFRSSRPRIASRRLICVVTFGLIERTNTVTLKLRPLPAYLRGSGLARIASRLASRWP